MQALSKYHKQPFRHNAAQVATGGVRKLSILCLSGKDKPSQKSVKHCRPLAARKGQSSIQCRALENDFGKSQTSIQQRKDAPNLDYSGVYWLLLLNGGIFLADHVLGAPWASSLYLNHAHPQWWQYLTAAFCHGSWQHLSNNAFMLLVFGRIVEEEEGTFGVWATYVLCAVGSSIASVLLQPRNMISLGASGAVFGMFAVSVLTKLQFKFRKLLEFAILGQFVLQQVLNEAKMQSQVWSGGKGLVIAGTQVGHLAHLAGAFAGVMIVFLLSKIPAPSD